MAEKTQKHEISRQDVSAEYFDFRFGPIFWYRSLFLKIFFAFLFLAVVPMAIASFLVISAYRTVLEEHVPPGELAFLAENVRTQFLLTTFFIIIVVAFIAFVISRNITRPVTLLIAAVKRIATGNLDMHIKIRRRDELGSLAHFFNTMVDKLKEIHERNLEISNIKSQFVSVAAHQLRTPLSAVKWTLRMVLDGDVGKLTGEQEEILERGYQTNERMIGLVNDLLDVSRIEEGRFGFAFREVPIVDVVKKAVEETSIPAARRNVAITLRILVKENLSIIADPDRVHTVLVNLLENAANYSDSGDQVTATLAKEGKYLKISVEDNGIGIPENEFGKVFSRFFRASNAIRLQTNGSGLGLFIAHNIVSRHGGRIWFESKEGQGTTFYFTLPLRREFAEESEDPGAFGFLTGT